MADRTARASDPYGRAGGCDGGLTMRPPKTRSHSGLRIDDRRPGYTAISPTSVQETGCDTDPVIALVDGSPFVKVNAIWSWEVLSGNDASAVTTAPTWTVKATIDPGPTCIRAISSPSPARSWKRMP